MKILSFDTSAKTAAAAVTEGEKILFSGQLTAGLTHSQTILALSDSLMKAARLSLDEIDVLAVSVGPGSFTGLRIGISLVKGLCQGLQKPCIGVSTLEALGQNCAGLFGTAVAVMDARREQVYTASFALKGQNPIRLTEDQAKSIESLRAEINGYEKPVYLVGDGALLCYEKLKDISGVMPAPPLLRMQNAASVGFAAAGLPSIPPEKLMPVYLRLPQAERELLEKQKLSENGKN